MTGKEVEHFLVEMSRRLRGELSVSEKQRIERRGKVYSTILKHNGGKNPILGF